MAERTAELRQNDQVLLVKSSQAAMGEMVNHIAHQWRQPLNRVPMLGILPLKEEEDGLVSAVTSIQESDQRDAPPDGGGDYDQE